MAFIGGRLISVVAALCLVLFICGVRCSDVGQRRMHKLRRRRLTAAHEGRFLKFRFLAEPTDTFITNGRVILNCSYTFFGQNAAAVITEWFRDGYLISDSDSEIRMNKQSNVSAEFEEVNRAGIDGTYYCRVTVKDDDTSWSYLSRKAIVRSPYLTRFVKQPTKKSVAVGDSVAFECSLSSYPKATITWYHNNEKLSGDFATVFPVTSTIEIKNVQPSHAGSYHCFASNAIYNRTSEDAQLSVSRQSFSGNHLSFELEPQDTLVKEGEPLVLECLINGVAPEEVTWWKNSNLLRIDRRKLIGSSSLYLKSVSVSDAGVYECRADSVRLSKTATVTVAVPPIVIKSSKDVVAQETADAEFECNVTGNPGPQIRWFKNGEAIVPSEYFMIEENRLKISGLLRKDQAVYQCLAENDVGSVQASAQLIVESSVEPPRYPSDPLHLRTTKIGSGFISLAWDKPLHSYGSVIRYQVYYKEIGSQGERNINVTENFCTVLYLQPDTRYMFRVVAVNKAGSGKSSGLLQVATSKEQLVPGKIRNLNARAIGSETIEVTWDPPVTGMAGAEVKNYILFYVRSEEAENGRETRITTTETSYVLRGMFKYTQYKIRVEANGSNGSGLTSEVVSVTTFSDVPSGSPLNVRAHALTTDSVKVKWDPVVAELRNGVITGYQIKCKAKGRDSKAVFFKANKKVGTYTINGLDREMEYHIRVAAINVNGTGPFSEAIKVVTLKENRDESHVPPSPMKLILNASNNSILAVWEPPSDPRVMIRGYQLGWGPSIPDLEKVDLDVDARNYTITGLNSDREYVVSLRAVNTKGPGYPIYESTKTYAVNEKDSFSDTATSSSLRPPVQVIAETLSSTSIVVSWLDLNNLSLDDRSYTVKCATNAGRGTEQRQNRIFANKVTMEGLYPDTQYECVVRVNSKGTSSFWSLTAVNTTFPSAPSSAPCDLTVNPSEEDPHTVILNWQPPKYANGKISEYIVYFTHRRDRPNDEWDKLSVSGDQMTCRITDLIPRTPYFFKVQARNVKGLSPLSKMKRFDPSAPLPRQFQIPTVDDQMLSSAKFFSNSIFIGVAGVTILLLIILIVLVICCMGRRDSRKGTSNGYVPGMKTATVGHPDLWIDQGNAPNTKDFSGDSRSNSSADLRRIGNVSDTIPQRCHNLKANGPNSSRRVSSSSGTYSSPPAALARFDYEPKKIEVAEVTPYHPHKYAPDFDNTAGTLTRSYHQSSSSLESRQRTPQVMSAASNRYLPSTKFDYSDHGSSYGSSQALQIQTPPPQLPNQGPPSGPPSQVSDAYRTLRANSSNPLRSFTQFANVPPPVSPSQNERVIFGPRPVVMASPSPRGKPSGIVFGQKSTQVPVGRATVHRVNVNNIYHTFGTNATDEKPVLKDEDIENRIEGQPLQQSNSTEELNAQMENLDTMIDDLQAMQHEFNTTS